MLSRRQAILAMASPIAAALPISSSARTLEIHPATDNLVGLQFARDTQPVELARPLQWFRDNWPVWLKQEARSGVYIAAPDGRRVPVRFA